MSTQGFQTHNSRVNTRRSVTYAKQKALNEIEFERLVEAASQIDDDYYRLQCQFVVLMLGRLGLRAGELAHISTHWVDQREQMINIPQHQACFGGRDGSLCSSCARLAKQMAEHNDDISIEQARQCYWRPKTDAAARGVYYGFSPRLEMIVERFFNRWDGWPLSYQVVARRVTRAAENAEGIDENELTPHPLRATAASYHAGRGADHTALMQHFGWADPAVATVYIERSAQATARQFSAIHSR